jgi:hypothetical protein
MSTDREDATARRYREASAALEERPSAATRAAILAAAARQVDARPRPADAPRTVRRPRWPLAAAAAVLLSTLAVMMANRTGQEMPSFTAPAERAPESVAIAPAPSAAVPPSSDNSAPLPAPPIAQSPAPIAKRPTAAKAREEGSSVPDAPTARLDAQRSDAASPAVSARSAERAPEVASAEARQERPAAPPVAAPAPPRAAPLARSAPAPAAQEAARLDAARDFEASAPMWLEHIVKLRKEGRDAEADAELKRFRARYPDVQVPSAALPGGAAGSR